MIFSVQLVPEEHPFAATNAQPPDFDRRPPAQIQMQRGSVASDSDVPEHVHVWLERTEIDTPRVDIEDWAELALLDHSMDLLDRGVATRGGHQCAHREPAYAHLPLRSRLLWLEGI